MSDGSIGKRRTRLRQPKRVDSDVDVDVKSPRKNSPERTKQHAAASQQSRPRRSSRSSTRTVASNASADTVVIGPVGIAVQMRPSPIKESRESMSPQLHDILKNQVKVTLSKYPAADRKLFTLSPTVPVQRYTKVNTEEKLEISSSITHAAGGTEVSSMREFIRRSVSKTIEGVVGRSSVTPTTSTTTTTHRAGSRRSTISRSSVYEDERDEDDDNDELPTKDDEKYKSFSVTQVNTSPRSSVQLCRTLTAPIELGGAWGILGILLIIPLLVLYLQWTCTKSNNCEFDMFPWPSEYIWQDANVWTAALRDDLFPRKVVAAYIGFVLSVFILSIFLPGKKYRQTMRGIDGGGGDVNAYRFNGPAIVAILTITLAYLQIGLEWPVATFILENYVRLCLYGLINAFIVAIWAYHRRSLWLTEENGVGKTTLLPNDYGRTGNWLVDFAQGRHINPRWLGNVELKLIYSRVAYLSAIILAQCCLYNAIRLPSWSRSESDVSQIPDAIMNLLADTQRFISSIHYDGGTVLAAMQLLFYASDAIIFEHHMASSFEMQSEGFGYLLLLRYAATPFLLGGVMRHFQQQQQRVFLSSSSTSSSSTLPSSTSPLSSSTFPSSSLTSIDTFHCQCLAAYAVIWIILFAGLTLKRLSMAFKYQYRLNPYQDRFHNVDSIHTFQDRRLLLGKLWGRVRQPNYAGDIVALCALALPLALPGRFAWPPLIGVILLIVVLLQRTQRVNCRNAARYHSSWVRYCSQVRSYIIPKVY